MIGRVSRRWRLGGQEMADPAPAATSPAVEKAERRVLSADLVYEEFLGTRVLDALQAQLLDVAPRWCTKLRVFRWPPGNFPVDGEEIEVPPDPRG